MGVKRGWYFSKICQKQAIFQIQIWGWAFIRLFTVFQLFEDKNLRVDIAEGRRDQKGGGRGGRGGGRGGGWEQDSGFRGGGGKILTVNILYIS